MGDKSLESTPTKKLVDLVLTFTGGFMERGSGQLIYTRVPPAVGVRLRAYIEELAAAARAAEKGEHP